MARHYCHVNVTIPSRQRALTQAYSNISKSTQAHAHTTTGQTRRRRHTACGRHNDDSKNASRNVSQSAVSRLVGGSFGQPICVNLSEVCKCMGVFVCVRVRARLIACVNHSICNVNECMAGVVIVVVDFYVAIKYMRFYFYICSFFFLNLLLSFFFIISLLLYMSFSLLV